MLLQKVGLLDLQKAAFWLKWTVSDVVALFLLLFLQQATVEAIMMIVEAVVIMAAAADTTAIKFTTPLAKLDDMSNVEQDHQAIE